MAARARAASDASSDEEGGDFDDWNSELEAAAVQSLLNPAVVVASATEAWEELRAAAGVDFPALRSDRKLDVHQCIRFINFCRSAVKAAPVGTAAAALRSCLAADALAPGAPLWTDDAWLKPQLEDDGLVLAALEEFDGASDDGAEAGTAAAAAAPAAAAGTGAASGGASGGAAAATSLEEANAVIARLQAQLASAHRLLQAVTGGDDDDTGSDSGNDGTGTAIAARSAPTTAAAASAAGAAGAPVNPTSAGVTGQDNDTYYFDSYAKIGIHSDMLRDKPRTEGYRDAIASLGPHGITGGTVLDVGCGTGILSMFSATRGGAARVVALDASNIIDDARAIVAANGLEGVVVPVRGLAERVDLTSAISGPAPGASSATAAAAPATGRAATAAPPRVDAIVSEWMGYALLYESMLNSVLHMRDKYLKPGGLLLPSHATIYVAGVSDAAMWGQRVDWWKDVYGFNMQQMQRHLFREPFVEVLPPSSIATTTAPIQTLNLLTMSPSDQDIVEAPFTITRPASGLPTADASAAASVEVSPLLHGLALWFDVDFTADKFDPAAVGSKSAPIGAGAVGSSAAGDDDDLPPLEADGAAAKSAAAPAAAASAPAAPAGVPLVKLSTSAFDTPTHWMQTLLLFESPVAFPPGSTASGTLSMARDAVNPREYRFIVDLQLPGGGKYRQSYHMA